MIKLHPSGTAPEGCFFMRFRMEAAAVALHFVDGYRNSALLISHFNFTNSDAAQYRYAFAES